MAASDYDPSLICPVKVVPIQFGDKDSEVMAVVTPWFDHGNVLDHVSKNPNADKLAMVLASHNSSHHFS